MIKIIIGVIVAAIIVIIILQSIDPRVDTSGTNTAEVSEMLTVSISGEITKPGTYLVDLDSSLGS
ncbi:MAG: hypothetical protein RBR94_04350 [Bacilli bacterium]|jgi:hypothetical protein|nr:hypothetical protein [Bacilli bacterium]